ncbi:hypothetical protein ITP53_49175, partial [Nonomuraea sp. K274]
MTAVIGWVDDHPIPRDRLDQRLTDLRDGPLRSALPVPGTSEDRQLARWLTQVILTEALCETTAAALGLRPRQEPPQNALSLHLAHGNPRRSPSPEGTSQQDRPPQADTDPNATPRTDTDPDAARAGIDPDAAPRADTDPNATPRADTGPNATPNVTPWADTGPNASPGAETGPGASPRSGPQPAASLSGEPQAAGAPLDRVAAVELGSINAAAYNGSPWVRALFQHVTAAVTVPPEWRRPSSPERPRRHFVRHRLFGDPGHARSATPADLEPLGLITLDSLPTAIAQAIESHPYGTLTSPVKDALGWHVAMATPEPAPPETTTPQQPPTHGSHTPHP